MVKLSAVTLSASAIRLTEGSSTVGGAGNPKAASLWVTHGYGGSAACAPIRGSYDSFRVSAQRVTAPGHQRGRDGSRQRRNR